MTGKKYIIEGTLIPKKKRQGNQLYHKSVITTKEFQLSEEYVMKTKSQ